MFDIEFWRNFLSNTLATLVGVGIGIPIALWINRRQQKFVESMENIKTENEISVRKKKIVQLVYNELKDNKQLLLQLYETRRAVLLFEEREYEHFYQLRVEHWNALSDGGELEWIHDLELLHAMALAYGSIKVVQETGKAYSTYVLNLSIQHPDPSDWPLYTKTHEKRLYKQMYENIKLALDNVEEALIIIKQGELN